MALIISATKRTTKYPEHIRANQQIPAVLYGAGVVTVPVVVGYRDFERLYSEAGESTLVDFHMEGQSVPVKVLVQDVQLDPVKERILHVDFRQIDMNREMEVDIEIEYVGESLAVKGLGGTLVKALDKICVRCLPKDLVGSITVDISVLKTFDDAIHVKDISYPSGVVAVEDAGAVVAKVLAPLSEDELKAMEEAEAPVDLSKIEVEEKGKKEESGEEGEAEGDTKKSEAQKKEEK